MGHFLQVRDLVLSNVQLFDVLTVHEIAQCRDIVVRQRDGLKALHFTDDGDIVDVVAPHVDVLQLRDVIVLYFVLDGNHFFGQLFGLDLGGCALCGSWRQGSHLLLILGLLRLVLGMV